MRRLCLISLLSLFVFCAEVSAQCAFTTNITTIDVSCSGGADGSATAIPSGGTGPFSYQWDAATGSQNTSTAFDLPVGAYEVYVTDDGVGCTDTFLAVINEPPGLFISTSYKNEQCGFADGQAVANVSGGIPPYLYAWNDSLGQTTDTAFNLITGSYTVSVTDNNGCMDSAFVTIGDTGSVYSYYTHNADTVQYGEQFFYGASGDTTRFEWHFGDGTLDSVNINPVHNYGSDGAWEACLYVYNDSIPGCYDYYCDTVFIGGGSCYAGWNHGPDTIQHSEYFDNYSTGGYDIIVLNYGDGTSDTNITFPTTHVYPDTGVYFACLTVWSSTDTTCWDQICDTLFIGVGGCTPQVTAWYSHSPDTIQYQEVFNWGVTGNYEHFEWHFGDGAIDSVNQNPVHNYGYDGSWEVCLNVWDSTGCMSTYCDSVFIGGGSCYAGWNHGPDTMQHSEFFDNYSTGGYDMIVLNYGDGTSDTNITFPTTHVYPDTGVYFACLTVWSSTDTTCWDQICDTLFIGVGGCTPQVTAWYSHSPDTIQYQEVFNWGVTGDYEHFEWRFGDGAVDSVNQSPVHNYGYDGSWEVCLNVWDSTGCMSTYCDSVFIGGGSCYAGWNHGPDTMQHSEFFDNYSTGGYDMIVLNYGDGTSDTNITFPTTHVYPDTGVYFACLTVWSSTDTTCWDQICDTLFIGVGGCTPQVTAWYSHSPDTIQYQEVFNWGVTGDYEHFEWRFGDGAIDSVNQNPVHNYGYDGSWEVCLNVWDSTGCMSTYCDSVFIGVDSCFADWNFYPDSVPHSVFFDNWSNGSWDMVAIDYGDGTSDTNITFPTTHVYPDTGEYFACLTVWSSTDTICWGQVCDTMYVYPAGGGCTAGWDHQPDTIPNTVIFNSTAGGPWDMVAIDYGDGFLDTNMTFPHSYTYPDTGLYYTCMTVWSSTDSTCWDQICDTLHMFPPAACNAEWDFYNDTVPNTMVFNNLSTGTWDMLTIDYGDGTSDTNITFPVSHTYPDTGEYLACLSISSTDSSCYHQVCDTMFVYLDSCDIIANFYHNADTVDYGEQFTFTATGSWNKFHWDFGDGSVDSVNMNPIHNYGGPGEWEACLSVYDDGIPGCSQVFCDSVKMNLICPITASIDSVTNHICRGDCVGEAWLSATGGTAPYNYSWSNGLTGSYESGLCSSGYEVIVTDQNGCADTLQVNLYQPLYPLTSSIISSTDATCGQANGSAQVRGGGGNWPHTFQWDDPNSQTDSLAVNLAAGTYTVAVTDTNGCTVVDTVVINDAGAVTLSLDSIKDASCNGICDGEAAVSASGGTAPYTYSWSSGGTAAIESGLCIGTYTVYVTDLNNCMDSLSITINEPTAVTTSTTSTDATCGQANGSATTTAGGGTGPYTYMWDDPNGQTTATASNLAVGTYSVEVKDVNGCAFSDTVIISDAGATTLTMDSTKDASCNGICDGEAAVSASGGTAPYTFSWSSGGTGALVAGLCAGTHTVYVTDQNNCMDSLSVTINEPTAVTASTTSTDASCGQADGSATTTAGGGTGPYTYIWNDLNVQTTATANNLAAGTYTVKINDVNGCLYTDTVVINDSPGATLALKSRFGASCNGACDGEATVNGSGGTLPYTYSWSSGGADTLETGLCAGVHQVTLTDANGCVDSLDVTISEPTVLTVSIASSDATCGQANGYAEAVAGGGAGNYTYQWDDPNAQTVATATNLIAGTYVVAVKDGNNCSVSDTVIINDAGGIVAVVDSTKDASCNGNCDGQAAVSATGGTMPYTFSWNNGGTSGIETGLCAGTYQVIITDVSNCADTLNITIAEPAILATTTTAMDANCGQADGQATVNATGGTGQYNYLWNNGQTAMTAVNLASGKYGVTVTDENGCSVTDSANVGNLSGVTATLGTVKDVACFGGCNGEATVVATGGAAPYVIEWDDPLLQTTETAIRLCAGTYNVRITDVNGCMDSVTASVSEQSEIVVTATSNDASCGQPDGSATVTSTGGAGSYTYIWNDPASQTSATATNLEAGAYTVIVADANNCETEATVTVNNLGGPTTVISSSLDATCTGSCDGEAQVTVTGGTAPYDYLWSNGDKIDKATGLCGKTYSVTVTDDNNCKSSATVKIGKTGIDPTISGTVRLLGGPMTKGDVKLFQYSPVTGKFPEIANTIVNGFGKFNFPNLPATDYIVQVIPDTAVHPNTLPTYSDSVGKWADAPRFAVPCDTNFALDMKVIELPVTTGKGKIQGTILLGSTNKNGVFEGDPVPDVDVTLEQIPGNEVKKYTTTDKNGTFKFANVPDGKFKLYVDIPGLPMDSTYDVEVDATDTTHADKNFNVDSTGIHVADSTTSSLISQTVPDHEWKIYPNPYLNMTNINYTLTDEADVELTVFNLLGDKVITLVSGNQPRGSYNYRFSAEKAGYQPGVYIVSLQIDGVRNIKRVVEIK